MIVTSEKMGADEQSEVTTLSEAISLLVLAKDVIKALRGKHAVSSVEKLIEDFLQQHCPDEEDPFS